MPDASSMVQGCKLRYVDDRRPGYRRELIGDAFVFYDEHGKRITDEADIQRIRRLAIPPAYKDVWICPDPLGHLQATGRDARGRKQYRYHPDWHAVRGAAKYSRMLEFGRAMPLVRRSVQAALRKPGLGREKVLAALVHLLERTLIRVGNSKYAKANRSFGLTTLTTRHATVAGSQIRFRFRGKSGINHDIRIADPRIARLLKRCIELPGQDLFQYVDDEGQAHHVESSDVNDYLQELAGTDFTAKDYRTWAGSVLALDLFLKRVQSGEAPTRTAVTQVMKDVSSRLANTAAVCRKCYVHPDIVDAFLAGELPASLSSRGNPLLSAAERRFLNFIKDRS